MPAETVQIGATCFSFSVADGRLTYFRNLQPFDFHDMADRGAMLLRAARFAESGVRRTDIEAAFGISRSTLKRAANKLRDRGEACFHEPRKERGTSVITGARKEAAERLLASGMGGAAALRRAAVGGRLRRRPGRAAGAAGGGPPAARGQVPVAAEGMLRADGHASPARVPVHGPGPQPRGAPPRGAGGVGPVNLTDLSPSFLRLPIRFRPSPAWPEWR